MTNNEIRDNTNIIRSLKNRDISVFFNFKIPLTRTALILMKNALTSLAKSVFVPLGSTPAALAPDAAIKTTIFESGMTLLIISIEEIDDVIKSGLLIMSVTDAIENEAKERKR